jgi:hypothetical protein
MMHQYNPIELKKLIEPAFSFLLNEGYSFIGVHEENKKLFGHTVTAKWKNDAIKRSLNVMYFESKPHAPMGTLIIKIENLDPPELDQYDITTMDSRDVTIPRLSDLTGSFEERCNECILLAKNQLIGKLRPLLNGEIWEPSSFDWGGLK